MVSMSNQLSHKFLVVMTRCGQYHRKRRIRILTRESKTKDLVKTQRKTWEPIHKKLSISSLLIWYQSLHDFGRGLDRFCIREGGLTLPTWSVSFFLSRFTILVYFQLPLQWHTFFRCLFFMLSFHVSWPVKSSINFFLVSNTLLHNQYYVIAYSVPNLVCQDLVKLAAYLSLSSSQTSSTQVLKFRHFSEIHGSNTTKLVSQHHK